MGGCTSKPSEDEAFEMHKPLPQQTDVSMTAVDKPSTSPPVDTAPQPAQESELEMSPVLSTNLAVTPAAHELPEEHRAVRTVISNAPDVRYRDTSNVISLDETKVRSGGGIESSFEDATTPALHLSTADDPSARHEMADQTGVATPHNPNAVTYCSPSAFTMHGASAGFEDTPTTPSAVIRTPNSSQAMAGTLRTDDNVASAARMNSGASSLRRRSATGTPRSQSVEKGRPRWNSTSAAAAAQARKSVTPNSAPRQARSNTPQYVTTPRRRTAPESIAPVPYEPRRLPGFMAATRASSCKLTTPVASPTSARAGRFPYGLMEPPSTAV